MVQWIPIDKEEKETWVIVTGKFHGWIQRLALVVDPFLGSPLFNFLVWAECDPGTPMAGF